MVAPPLAGPDRARPDSALGLAATVLPGWLVSLSGSGADENHRLDAIANARGALLGVLAPLVVAIGAIAAYLNYRVAAANLAETAAQNRRTYELGQQAFEETQRQNRETLDVTRRGQLTERFTTAIEQLGQTTEDKLDIRLGGIYALEQIAKESQELHGPVMEILTAFLREHSRKPGEASAELEEGDIAASTHSDAASNEHTVPLRADFQAIATVLGRREVSHDPDGFRLDVRGVALGVVDFRYAQLEEANFGDAQLEEANFRGAQLKGAVFNGAQLKGANFESAQLQGAHFWSSQLQRANFGGAQLQHANFEDAQLQHADFHHARLQNAYFGGAQLHRASFFSAPLQNVYFGHARLRKAGFLHAQLQEANFGGADLEGAKFQDGETDEFDACGLTPGQFDDALNVDKALPPNYLAEALKRSSTDLVE